MRRVIVQMSVSLDGFVARADHDLSWIFPSLRDDTMRWSTDFLRTVDTHLIGRVNYLEQAAHWPSSTEDIAPLINDAAKIVFSRTLDTVDWKNARLATAEPAQEIAALKKLPGRHIFVPGGAGFVRSLVAQRLVDEFRLLVHPIALGDGLPLFAQDLPLRLVSAQPMRTGVVAVTYEPLRG